MTNVTKMKTGSSSSGSSDSSDDSEDSENGNIHKHAVMYTFHMGVASMPNIFETVVFFLLTYFL